MTAALEANLLRQIISMRDTILYDIFLDMRKLHDALDRERCLDILAVYGLGSSKIRILRTYWYRLQVTAKVGGHYRTTFQSHHRVTQGDPLLPTIFKLVVYAIIRHWVTVVEGPRKVPYRRAWGKQSRPSWLSSMPMTDSLRLPIVPAFRRSSMP